MKIVRVLMLVSLLGATGITRAEIPVGGPGIKGVGVANAALTELLGNSHWAWYEGDYGSYTKNMKYWVEFYKDGTARVPWRDHAQAWTLTDNILTVSDPKAGDKSIFTMNLESKSGSTENQKLHIRYEKRASKPARLKK